MSVMSEYEIKSRFAEVEVVDISKLHHHPLNPRKDLGDLDELTKSIEKNGIMQNLTVVPGEPCQGIPDGEYFVLIGNRRFEASKAAGLKELPCKIVKGMSTNEQVAVMLEENMQRADLTIVEQAKGFQMMLDLGETITDITEKTGFSETTVRHRVKLAELDEDALKAAVEDRQLTLTDLQKLEKIKSIDTRNELLKKGNLADWAIKDAVEKEQMKELEKEWLKELQKNHLAEVLPSDAKTWESGWNRVWYSNTANTLEELPTSDLPEERLYIKCDRYQKAIYIISDDEEKPDATDYEKASEKCDAIKGTIEAVYKKALKDYKECLAKLLIESIDSYGCKLKYSDMISAWEFTKRRNTMLDINDYTEIVETAIKKDKIMFDEYTHEDYEDEDGELIEVDGESYVAEKIFSDMGTITEIFLSCMYDAPSSLFTITSPYQIKNDRTEMTLRQKEVLEVLKPVGFELGEKEKAVFTLQDKLFDEYLEAIEEREEARK